MGLVELDEASQCVTIHSAFYFYGDGSSESLAAQIAHDISHHWNEPNASARIDGKLWKVRFEILGFHEPALAPEKVWYNDDPKLNFFRIEDFATGNISFVDGLGCNTGYFLLSNLLQTSTTAAHEYGHTLGLGHPKNIDIRGKSIPGIMYPRGTICDARFQYDPHAAPGTKGGTLDPAHRRVLQSDVDLLRLNRLLFTNKRAILGAFTSIYHSRHVAA